MNGSSRDDDLRFEKLYELLGDDVNTIFDTKENDEVFADDLKDNVLDDKTINVPNEIVPEPTKINYIENINDNNLNSFNDLVNPFDNTRGKEIKSKIKKDKQVSFDDGIDSDNDKENKFINIISNRRFLYILAILIFVFVIILAIKAIRFGKIIDSYNDYVSEEDNNIKVYEGNSNNEIYKGGKASELVECITSPIDMNNLPDDINNAIREINNYYRSSGNYYAFTYKDIFTGFTVSYNENGAIFAASTIKAPVNIYLYEMASEGKINLDEELTYTSNYYNNGTGVLKNKPVNTSYAIRTLSEYAIRNSDNAAHNMLVDKYGRNNILNFWKEKGTKVILSGNDNWGMISAYDATIYMEELYKFYRSNSEYGEELMNNFLNTKTKFIVGKNDYKVANKSGWSDYSQHDASIIFADNPYIVIALSNMGMSNNYMNHFNRVNDLAYELHTTYWKYKMNKCSDIKLN